MDSTPVMPRSLSLAVTSSGLMFLNPPTCSADLRDVGKCLLTGLADIGELPLDLRATLQRNLNRQFFDHGV